MTRPTCMLELDDLDAFIEHMVRHRAESGLAGSPPFMPYSRQEPWDAEAALERNHTRWSTSPGEPGWGRCWAAREDGHVIAHASLQAPSLRSGTHRATLTLGVERGYRRRGLGRTVSEQAIAWARRQPFLDWLDLGVFAHNGAARRLYHHLGFHELGVVRDRFRVDGTVIDDIAMARWVGADGNAR